MSPEELRALDVGIHTELFGFTDVRRLLVSEGPDGCTLVGPVGEPIMVALGATVDRCYLPTYDHAETDDIYCLPVPHYSTDTAAAHLVIEAMGRWMFDAKWGFVGGLCVGDWEPVHTNLSAAGWTVRFGSDAAIAPTFAEAVCVAARAAVRKKATGES